MLHQKCHHMQLNLNHTKNYAMNYSVSKFHSNQIDRKKTPSDLLDLLGTDEWETVELQFMLKL